ncbi:hypothetical protein GUITHDRAFT_154784 [Guillardia theta CCMP2712]|uniref:Uncharacterized protein n=1 Tax=Guillardia theta (strain CCMP2712) TaxID=905079 RepID=L1IPG3_GUITC|nr:hypothetical protein GUITHDRAFT_154784 [Guillardia theta CCMP2712]EKX38181.1 hypothetical protein GUITHDRAFT_154784 [Guillardia theta CCMP2712]|eukprot:XP_005825161.1 hypothetical protein GUITHDRAFT_154784 [Guillardia theta CCMP2712]
MGGAEYARIVDVEVGAVAPGTVFLRSNGERSRKFGRASALIVCCAAAACVALLGGLGKVPQDALSISKIYTNKGEAASALANKQALKLAASANSLSSTAAGILQDARMHASLSTGYRPTGARETELSTAPSKAHSRAHAHALKEVMKTMHSAQILASNGSNTSQEKSKVLGASGDKVFGGANSTVAGFLGFKKDSDPNFLGIPFPIVMFIFVFCGAIAAISVGCLIARKTDLLKVNKEEAGGPARPVDEEPDTKGYNWRNQED